MAGTVSRSEDPRDDLQFADIGKLSRLLRTRKLSSLELTRHVLERLRAEGPRYNAVAQSGERRERSCFQDRHIRPLCHPSEALIMRGWRDDEAMR